MVCACLVPRENRRGLQVLLKLQLKVVVNCSRYSRCGELNPDTLQEQQLMSHLSTQLACFTKRVWNMEGH